MARAFAKSGTEAGQSTTATSRLSRLVREHIESMVDSFSVPDVIPDG